MEASTLINSSVDGVDIIGDVHGCANTLEKLLLKLGYKKNDGVYQYPSRKVIFVGDIVDRGPHIREALALVRAMTDNGQAICILGNHEFNAVSYTTVIGKDADEPVYMRAHDRRNNRMIRETLIQFASFPEEWRSYLDWFKTLPLFIETNDFRVVHACWHQNSVDSVLTRVGTQAPAVLGLFDALKNSDPMALKAIDRLTRGTSLRYPDNRFIVSRDGVQRNFFRTKFWAQEPVVYQDVVFQPDPLPEDLSNQRLSNAEKKRLICYSENEKPVFFGHYWLQGSPRVIKNNLACLDYSAVKYGRLVAYRYDGESKLSNEKFVWVYVDPEVREAS